MASWFSGPSSSSTKKEKEKEKVPTTTTKHQNNVPQEWPCACEHCFGIISKLPAPVTDKNKDKDKDSPLTSAAKPTWQAAARLLGQTPVGYTRYPFLEQYAENVLQLQRHQVLRMRVEDIRKVLGQRRIVVPELFDYPEGDYEGIKEATSTTTTSPTTSTTPTTATPVLDVEGLVAKLTEALRDKKKQKKHNKKKREKRHRRQQKQQEEEEGDEEEGEEEDGGEGEEEEEEEEGEEEVVEEERPRGGGRRR